MKRSRLFKDFLYAIAIPFMVASMPIVVITYGIIWIADGLTLCITEQPRD